MGDKVADVVESSLQWRSDFQSGSSRVLKKVFGQFRLSGNNFIAFYKAPDFCWQIEVNSPQHLTPCL